jgi:cob(I)alamin adenosyltransferase
MARIYTRKGDNGYTKLISSDKILKSDIKIEALGSIDELLAHIYILNDLMNDYNENNSHLASEFNKIKDFLFVIQFELMKIAEIIARDDKNYQFDSDIQVKKIEYEIDKIENELSKLNTFIIPVGHIIISHCNLLRTVCRRVERNFVKYVTKYEINSKVLMFLNRLSDYFFVLTRYFLKKLNKKEIIWK